jgi:hypothetical protein
MEKASVDELRETIRRVHGCESKWVESVPVTETFWRGEVQVFQLLDHPTAERCYAWSQQVGREKRNHAVLHGATVDSAPLAVRATIAARERTRVL